MKDIFICECGSLDHTYMFYYGGDSVYFVSRLVNYKSFRQRVKRAIGYVFNIGKRKGKICNLGDFDEIIISPEDARKIVLGLNRYLKNHK